MIYKIKDENLNNASCNALMEANRWNAVAMQIDNQKGLYREKIVILAYSSELYFKCILMNNGINITSLSKEVLKNGHNLFELFKLLPNKTKELIKNELSFEPVMVMDFFTGRIKQKCSTIEEILQLISTNFLELRYIYI